MGKLKEKRHISLNEIIYLPKNISYIRRAENKTLKEFGSYFEYSDAAVNRWEKGDRFPDIIDLVKFHEIFGYSLDELVLKDITQKVEMVSPKVELAVNSIHSSDSIKRINIVDFSEKEIDELIMYADFIRSKRKK